MYKPALSLEFKNHLGLILRGTHITWSHTTWFLKIGWLSAACTTSLHKICDWAGNRGYWSSAVSDDTFLSLYVTVNKWWAHTHEPFCTWKQVPEIYMAARWRPLGNALWWQLWHKSHFVNTCFLHKCISYYFSPYCGQIFCPPSSLKKVATRDIRWRKPVWR